MEPYDPTAALTNDLMVHQAQGVLAALLDIPIHDAAVSLDLRAQFRGLPLGDAARQVLEDHEQRISATAPRNIDDRSLAVLRQHLDRATSPLDEQTHADATANGSDPRNPTGA